MSLKAVQTSSLMQAYFHQLKHNELRTKAITAGTCYVWHSRSAPYNRAHSFMPFLQAFWVSSKRSSRDILQESRLVKSTHPLVRSSTSSRHQK